MPEDKSKISVKIKFTQYLEQKKLRKTPERFAILDMVFSFSDHFDIETLYAEMEKSTYHVSRATVYNTIDLLYDAGLVRKHQFGNQQTQYERVTHTGNHHHLICTKCGKIREVKDPAIIELMNNKKYGRFNTSYFSLYVYGLCAKCSKEEKNKLIK